LHYLAQVFEKMMVVLYGISSAKGKDRALAPRKHRAISRGGQPWSENRLVLEGVLWIVERRSRAAPTHILRLAAGDCRIVQST
jgi:hypothetical protein